MTDSEKPGSTVPVQTSDVSRRSFIQKASLIGATGVAAFEGLLGVAPAWAKDVAAKTADKKDHDDGDPKKRDRAFLIAAEIAEALAVTTYTNIINQAPFFAAIPDDDQNYLRAARQEEMSHYLLEQSVTGEPSPFTSFFYPAGMFSQTQTTLNVLVTLEDAFVAAYLVGVRNFSDDDLRVTAARIMGIESDHRTLARVVGADAALSTITGIQGVAEDLDPPNNNGYERTLCWTRIEQAVQALTPFVDVNAAKAQNFDTSKSFDFEPFTPQLPFDRGDFISFKGC